MYDGLPWPRDDVIERSRRATLPLFKPRGRRKPELVGCSVGARRGSDFFLFTARHVVVDLGMTDFLVWTPGAWIPANGRIVRTKSDSVGRDPFDAAVIALDPAAANRHLHDHALTAQDFDLPEIATSGHVMQLVGYPGGEVREEDNRTLTPTFYQWTGVAADPPAYAKRGRAPSRHCLIEFDRSKAIHDTKGRWNGPNLNGASGAGMWRVLRQAEAAGRHQSALLNAIFTEYEGRTLIGTRIGAHLGLVHKHFPPSSTRD